MRSRQPQEAEARAYRQGRLDGGREVREEAAQLVEQIGAMFSPRWGAQVHLQELIRRIRTLRIHEGE